MVCIHSTWRGRPLLWRLRLLAEAGVMSVLVVILGVGALLRWFVGAALRRMRSRYLSSGRGSGTRTNWNERSRVE